MNRRGYLDWLRGVAVLIMIEGHSLDAWVRPSDRSSWLFGAGILVAGIGGPLFLFLAGVAVVLAIAGRTASTGDRAFASRSVRRRGWQIFGLAFLFRLQSKLLSGGSWSGLLKVDILNIMGPSIALAAAIGGRWQRPGPRLLAFGALTVLAALATPLVRASAWVHEWPVVAQAYVRPVPGLTNFTFFPWVGFVLAGAFVGVLLEVARDARAERRTNGWLLLGGVGVVAGGYGASWLPPLYAGSSFWTSSPTYFFIRLGILLAALPLAYLWSMRATVEHPSPLRQFGRTSLFVYWIHVEMAYGRFAQDLHRQLAIGQWTIAFFLFAALLLGLSLCKDAIASRVTLSPSPSAVPGGSPSRSRRRD